MLIGIGLAVADGVTARTALAGAALLAYATVRTMRPLRYPAGTITSLLGVLADIALSLLVVVATGYWSSPFVLCVLTAVIAAGLARGYAFAVRTAVAAIIAVAVPLLRADPDAALRDTVQWAFELVLVAVIAGYYRRLSTTAHEQTTVALSQIDQLGAANGLLVELHRLAQSLPASLDLDETIRSTVAELRTLFPADVVVVLVPDETTDDWLVMAAEGVRLQPVIAPDALPRPLAQAVASPAPRFEPALSGPAGPGVSPLSQAGLYVGLRARDHLVGLVAVENRTPGLLEASDADLLSGVADQAALAIDNARWFGRLRTVGADEERTRIARELHDRLGQSLAYLAFELDRIMSTVPPGPVRDDLERLRRDVRTVVGEVREALYDLRTDVTETRDLTATLEAHLERVRQRTSLDITFRNDAHDRLPILQEREMWRIAQEAVANVERHAKASKLSITWQCEGGRASLEVVDDGRGMVPGIAGRIDSYGILGMRERADAIGATLEILPGGTKGTVVRCRLEPLS